MIEITKFAPHCEIVSCSHQRYCNQMWVWWVKDICAGLKYYLSKFIYLFFFLSFQKGNLAFENRSWLPSPLIKLPDVLSQSVWCYMPPVRCQSEVKVFILTLVSPLGRASGWQADAEKGEQVKSHHEGNGQVNAKCETLSKSAGPCTLWKVCVMEVLIQDQGVWGGCLAGSIRRACDSWFGDCEFKPRFECRAFSKWMN